MTLGHHAIADSAIADSGVQFIVIVPLEIRDYCIAVTESLNMTVEVTESLDFKTTVFEEALMETTL